MSFMIKEKSHREEPHIINEERKLASSTSALGILREKLVENLGIQRIDSFLFHYGYEMGVHDAKEAKKTDKTIEELIIEGPKLHMKSGHIQGFEHKCQVEYDGDQLKSVTGKGTWIGSYEAYEHKKRLGVADTPVCYTLLGYSSGFMSTIFERELIARELTCTGAGHAECRWVIRLKEEWEQDAHEDIYNQHSSPIVQELEYTYDQLFDQTNLVTKLSTFQNLLTKEIVDGSDLQTLTNRAYEIIKRPLIIDDLKLDPLSFAGISEERIKVIDAESKQKLPGHVVKNRKRYAVPFRKKIMELDGYLRCIVPVMVENEIYGYCSLLIKEQKEQQTKEEFLFLEHFANAVALILLNEKTRFDSYERMKGNFFEQVLENKSSTLELLNKAKYIGFNLNKPFYIAVVEYVNDVDSIEEEFAFNEHIMEATFQFFNKERLAVLSTLRETNVILYLPDLTERQIENVLNKYLQHLSEEFPQTYVKIGLSQNGEGIVEIKDRYHEATIALRLAIKKAIVSYETLGIVGLLLNTRHLDEFHVMAKKELKELYQLKEEKRAELLKTLYYFLENGGNLERTKGDLALSMSGLRHRIQRLEELLDRDLRKPSEAHSLFLLLKALVVLEELALT
ncbi:XylR N-terminal domain-containing protein [Alkalihalobacillus sp. LMS6]|uniref:XylR N-terminal domain-containing protein n=1 Tax=Alkalihalobacillus sp. LMS6 TaxID=2924034 RepID=UPI0020D0B49D|nr:XylR N-terminal domain-containing protein [Alkalihalobacillus sp. LMS6]UTR07536.1 XylR N-terminal domain-containing protein [Alkalihalobacillus sp. LMS6]